MKNQIWFLLLLPLLVAIASPAVPVPALVKKTVAFVYLTDDPTNSTPDGTGFFVGLTNASGLTGYFVTAKHVLRPPPRNEFFRSVYIRVNRRDGTSEKIFIPLAAEGANKNVFTNQDPTVDIAVIPFLPNPTNYDLIVTPVEAIPNEQDFKTLNIHEGSDVFFTGMFVPHLGEKQNTPITRFGKVALMTDEKIDWPTGKTPLYLMEANSYPGNSGSPVFFQVGMERENGFVFGGTTIKLAGIMSGCYSDVQAVKTVSAGTNQVVTPNMGIAGVVPSYELKDIIYSSELKAQRGEE